jgi:hypothetical protein
MSIYVILALLLVLSFTLKSPIFKGFVGEKSVIYQLNKLDKEKYFILNNITIPSTKGKTTQIDHIVVSEYGIFVIETKNYKGWILGDEKSDYWTQVIFKRKERLYNPLRQNFGHIQALKALLGEFEEIPFMSVISFSIRADLKVKVTTSEVIYTKHLLRTINKYKEVFLARDEVRNIYNTFQAASIKDENVKKDHVKAIKSDMAENNNKIANNECPKCGGMLVERRGKYGKFKGCGNFPRCRFVLN